MIFILNLASSPNAKAVALKPGSGNIIIKDHVIKFDKVPLVTPNGDVLIQEMSFEVSCCFIEIAVCLSINMKCIRKSVEEVYHSSIIDGNLII